jgi:uncharacterized repeat protein (TIGR01451 family)
MHHRRNSCLPTLVSQSLRHMQRYAAWAAGGIALTGILMGIAPKAIAQVPPKFTDPPANYPAAWPLDNAWKPYKINGGVLRDDSGDGTNGGTSPQGSSNISPCLDQTASTYFVRDTNNLYFRICLASDPYQSNNGPFDSSTTWSILIDTTGDGYRDFVVTVDGKGGSGDQAPDNLYVLYKNDRRQDFLNADVDFGSGSAVLWAQDSAKGTTANTTDGNETSWDVSPSGGANSTYTQDFKRTRITKNSASSSSTYFLDVQVPLSAFDAGSGGSKITSTSSLALAFAAANSNTNPIQKDFTAVGNFTVDPSKPVPFGDAIGANNETYDQPSIPAIGVGGTACSARTLTAQVQDSIIYNGTNFVSSVNTLKFYYQRDTDGNGLPDYTASWTEIGNGTISDSTNQSLWTFSNWNTSGLLTGTYFIKAVATDGGADGNSVTTADNNTTDSTDAVDGTGNNNTGGDTFNPATLQSTPVAPVFASFSNTCGANPPTIDLDGDNSSGATGNDFKTTYTLAGSSVGIVDANTPTTETLDTVITDADSTQLSRAVVDLTNAQTGDTLSISGSLPTGISLDPSSTATRIILTSAVPVIIASYETALEQIRFSSTSGNLSDRTATVQVTDSTNLVSNFATTTITITGTDFGDAPTSLTAIDATLTNTYPSASHTLDGMTFLGDRVDADAANPPNINADGDDLNGSPNDEDGVTFPLAGTNRVLSSGQSNTLSIKASRAGILNAWIDWNQDGDWNDTAEQIATNVNLTAGSNTLTITTPNTAPHGATYARFRFSNTSGLGPTGATTANGEVEDYKVNLVLPAPVACNSGVLNNGFEQPVIPGSGTGTPPILQDFGNGRIVSYREADVPWWGTISNSPSSGSSFDQRNAIELWNSTQTAVPAARPFEGNQFAEINAYVAGRLYQDLAVPPGSIIRWQVAHRGRAGNDTMGVLIGSPESETSQGTYTTPNTEWRVYSGIYTVPNGQFITRFALKAVNTSGGAETGVGNFVDDVRLSNFCAPTVQGYKSVKLTTDADNNNKISPGDTLTYTLYYANSTGSATGPAAGFQINDPLPSGLTITATGAQTITVSGGNTSANKNSNYTGAASGAISDLLNPGALLDVGGAIRVDIPVMVDPTASGTLLNQGTSSANEFSGQNVKTDNVDNTNTGLPTSVTIPVSSVAQSQTPTIDPTQVTIINPAVSSNPNLLLVKRITAIRGGTTTINGDNLAAYTQDDTYPYDDNEIEATLAPNAPAFPTADTDKWPLTTGKTSSTFLIGGQKGGATKPGDEVEYTIYFLSAGNGSAKNVTICDRIPPYQTFVLDAFNGLTAAPNTTPASSTGDRGIAVFQGSTTNPETIYGYTNVSDGDTAQYYPPGSTLPSACAQTALAEDNGAIVVNLGNLPNAISPGTPKESYGFLRFRTKVK